MKKVATSKIFLYILIFVSLISIFLIAIKHPLEGFIIGSIVSILYSIYYYYTNQKPLIIVSLAYLISEIIGIFNYF